MDGLQGPGDGLGSTPMSGTLQLLRPCLSFLSSQVGKFVITTPEASYRDCLGEDVKSAPIKHAWVLAIVIDIKLSYFTF